MRLEGPHGARTATASSVDDLPATYAELVHAVLVVPPPVAVADLAGPRVAPAIVPDPRADAAVVPVAEIGAPAEAAAALQGMYYVRLGVGEIANGGSGGSRGAGYRRWFGANAGDLSAVSTTTDRGSSVALAASVLHYLQPVAPASIYVGGGLAVGGTKIEIGDRQYSGAGVQVGFTLGAEVLATERWRLFVQAEAALPLYHLDDVYPASLGLTFGAGYGR